MQENRRLTDEQELAEAVRQLLASGVTLDDLPLTLCRIAPYDADLLSELLPRFAKAA